MSRMFNSSVAACLPFWIVVSTGSFRCGLAGLLCLPVHPSYLRRLCHILTMVRLLLMVGGTSGLALSSGSFGSPCKAFLCCAKRHVRQDIGPSRLPARKCKMSSVHDEGSFPLMTV